MSRLPKNTGERVIEEHYMCSRESYLIYLMHVATYDYILAYVTGKHVLDLGCGTGYGTARIAGKCASICGVDISDEAITYATQKYHAPNLTYRTIRKIEDKRLPFADATFDVIISFQVIEHISDTETFLDEVCRLLKPSGLVIVATPDRSTRLLPAQRPWNRYHVTEYSDSSLVKLLSSRFPEPKLLRMSGRKAVIDIELKRTRYLKWLTLPITFPLAPEWLRLHGLDFLKRLNMKRSQKIVETEPSYEFSENDIFIGENIYPSVNLIALARKS
jgi:SAM-dependent methyltransferase